MNHSLIAYAAVCVAPALAFAVLEKASRVWMGTATWRSDTPWQVDPQVQPLGRPLERLTADLSRLSGDMARLRSAGGYARRHHRMTTAAAYDDVLRECARMLEVPVPDGEFDDVLRLQVEADLARAGLVW